MGSYLHEVAKFNAGTKKHTFLLTSADTINNFQFSI